MTEKTYHYFAYGLGIQSDLRLPELAQGPARVDIRIRAGSVNQAQFTTESHRFWAEQDQIVLHWEPIGTFLIRSGQEIIVDPAPMVAEDRLRLFLLGAAMAALLYQRGFTVLHASAVATNDSAIAFLGGKGWGKSTMAAMFHALGQELITDDVLAIDCTQGVPQVLPGYAQLKLWPDTIASIGQDAELLPRLHSKFEKRDYRVKSKFSSLPVSLKHIFILDHDAQPGIEPINGSQALIELLPHWYCARFGMQMLKILGSDIQFFQCANLVKHVSIYRLKRPRSLAALSEVALLVQRHIGLDIGSKE